MYNVTLRRVRTTVVQVEKAIKIAQLVCVFLALGIQYAMRMRHIVICGLTRPENIFPHYLINGTIFEKKLLNIKCVFRVSLQLLSETFFILRRTERDIIENVYRYSCKVPFILARF
jgi:hypothetical protein